MGIIKTNSNSKNCVYQYVDHWIHLLHTHWRLQMSQHEHDGETWLQLVVLKWLISISLLHVTLFVQYSFISSSKCRATRSGPPWYRTAFADCPSRPARPVSCRYSSIFSEGPQWMMHLTFGQSRPIPNAIVAMTIRNRELGSINDFKILSLISGRLQAVNISTIRKAAISGAPMWSVISLPTLEFMYKYDWHKHSRIWSPALCRFCRAVVLQQQKRMSPLMYLDLGEPCTWCLLCWVNRPQQQAQTFQESCRWCNVFSQLLWQSKPWFSLLWEWGS